MPSSELRPEAHKTIRALLTLGVLAAAFWFTRDLWREERAHDRDAAVADRVRCETDLATAQARTREVERKLADSSSAAVVAAERCKTACLADLAAERRNCVNDIRNARIEADRKVAESSTTTIWLRERYDTCRVAAEETVRRCYGGR